MLIDAFLSHPSKCLHLPLEFRDLEGDQKLYYSPFQVSVTKHKREKLKINNAMTREKGKTFGRYKLPTQHQLFLAMKRVFPFFFRGVCHRYIGMKIEIRIFLMLTFIGMI